MIWRKYRWVLLGTGVVVMGVATYVYYTYDPVAHSWFPQCPFKALTGFDCPGCGSQRAVHAILHGDFREALHHNALLLPFIPYLTFGFGYRFVKDPNEHLLKWRKILFGEYAIKVLAAIIFAYFVLRNVM
ncbi:DUF2752 domain-containing protein [Sphingobacterium sp. SGR-19]|uniref:DUF2752 domain-containing protein n=1 Tax=Sphingobacterium sp. SGR-19 TaxID=2710886 RepID=UPI0013E9D9D4|nr:DUF2752 domain-containing protein [Sphingobacterium sp. SGR-19]NGM66204.1 DUF2752 domain-containing protein [Sphingobacterium sp. SGR-19]